MFGRLSLVAAVVLLAASTANAQLCAGAASYASGKMQVGGQFTDVGDDYSSYGVGLNFGKRTGLYGGGSIGNNDYEFLDESGLWIGAGGGYQLQPMRNGAQICPVVSLNLGMGPNDIGGTGTDMSARQFAAGATVGMVAHRTPTFQIIPTGGLSIVNWKITLDGPGGSADESDTFFALDLGAGFVFNSVWTIRPMLSIPFGDDGRDESFGLNASYNFGRPAGAAPARRPTPRR